MSASVRNKGKMESGKSHFPLFFSKEHIDRNQEGRDSDGLRYGEITGNHKAPGIAAVKFDDKTGHGIKEQIIPNELALETFFPAHEG